MRRKLTAVSLVAALVTALVVLWTGARSGRTAPPPPAGESGQTPTNTIAAEFRVDGMFCSLCAANLARVLADHPGVTAARVELGEQVALVQYNPAAITTAEVEAIIEETGVFRAELLTRSEPTGKE